MSKRLQEMLRRDKLIAMYGDSPPPQRTAAPYPEGEVIYKCTERYIVRHGNTVTKYAIHPDGMGVNEKPNEALVLQFIKENTTIPVPEVISSDWDRIELEYIEGQTLKEAWPSLEPHDRTAILGQLKDYLGQLRALKGFYIGRFDGQGAVVPSMMTRSGGPFTNLESFQEWLVRPPKRIEEQSLHWAQMTKQLGEDYPIVFTHGDISSRNIMIRDGRIVAILDWEWAGWYPVYWDYVFALRGLDNVDWKTLGSHVPSLFDERYDLEYILVCFIVSLS
ncbi:hypothetical protein J7337_007779 [Fusarium musae]|uniref:Aminoglycoside phosphotransferase domain-containing protein n=1 Tax=Fusarium musae TaxID=1042133 RepID=A0A9P8DHI5_9HYPO|nr:hypothetical protein J7337_007779 [Fusarium musae]KAG9502065.1 hypothetical protein J7337_007779 [Fusarium musae]